MEQQPGQPDSMGIAMSKSQMKKHLRHQKYLANRPKKRQLEKEKRRAKRRLLAEERDTTQQSIKKHYTLMSESNNKFRVVIDMDFENYMTDSEIGKAVQQIARVYSINRHSENPVQLYISSLNGKIKEKCAINNVGYQNWDVNMSELNYLNLFIDKNGEQTSDTNKINNDNFIYLSGDANETLADAESLLKDDSKIFVIGGLVDHNRHKNLCHERALERGIKTAKLPIEEHLTLNQRRILSTVTVFEILLHILGSHKQWPEALLEAIPKRKIASSELSLREKVNNSDSCRQNEKTSNETITSDRDVSAL